MASLSRAHIPPQSLVPGINSAVLRPLRRSHGSQRQIVCAHSAHYPRERLLPPSENVSDLTRRESMSLTSLECHSRATWGLHGSSAMLRQPYQTIRDPSIPSPPTIPRLAGPLNRDWNKASTLHTPIFVYVSIASLSQALHG